MQDQRDADEDPGIWKRMTRWNEHSLEIKSQATSVMKQEQKLCKVGKIRWFSYL